MHYWACGHTQGKNATKSIHMHARTWSTCAYFLFTFNLGTGVLCANEALSSFKCKYTCLRGLCVRWVLQVFSQRDFNLGLSQMQIMTEAYFMHLSLTYLFWNTPVWNTQGKFLEIYSLHSCWFHTVLKIFLHFQEKIKYNDYKNVMWCNHKIHLLNYFIYT